MELIDIKLDQVNEWLVLRRKLDKNWARQLKPIETRQGLALSKLIEAKLIPEVPETLQGYLQCKEVLASIMSTSEVSKGKSVFGNYNSEFLYEWESILKLYEKNSLSLADCGKHLLQLGVYEIPSLKSTLLSYEKQLKEYTHKESSIQDEIQKKSTLYKEKCKSYQIEGTNLAYELKLTTRKIPELYLKIISDLQSAEFSSLLSTYERLSSVNHSCKVQLPIIYGLREFDCSLDIESVKNKYCKLIVEGVQEEIEAVEEIETEWVIEMVEEDRVIYINDDDLPLADRQLRGGLVNELTELAAFADAFGDYGKVVEGVFKIFGELHEPILIHEQSNYTDNIISQLNRIKNHNLQQKLQECQKLQEGIKQSLKATHEKICDMLRFAGKLILFIEGGINKLFPNISIKIVGETVKDIRQYLG